MNGSKRKRIPSPAANLRNILCYIDIPPIISNHYYFDAKDIVCLGLSLCINVVVWFLYNKSQMLSYFSSH